jgi:signal transduction histidine kinase
LLSISRSGRHLLYLISDILDLSKIEAGKVDLKKKMISIHSLLDDLAPLVWNLIGTKPLEFSMRIHDGIDFIYADENKVHQILLNLLTNAVKFTHEGHIRLFVHQRDAEEIEGERFVEFVLEDTGTGIPDSNLCNIFDEFKQIDKSSRNQDGSGLGLSITRKLVELGGGTIWVESDGYRGSRFHFTVPTSPSNAAVTQEYSIS